MPLSDDIRGLADQVLDRVDEAREFYAHSRQAWRLVQQLARKGRPGLILVGDLWSGGGRGRETRAQRDGIRPGIGLAYAIRIQSIPTRPGWRSPGSKARERDPQQRGSGTTCWWDHGPRSRIRHRAGSYRSGCIPHWDYPTRRPGYCRSREGPVAIPIGHAEAVVANRPDE